MKIRLSRTSAAWLAIAGLMYLAAITLTMMVTWADGGVLGHGSEPSRERRNLELAIMVEGLAPPPEDAVWVRLVEAGQGERLLISFPPGLKASLVTNELRDSHACDFPSGRQPEVKEIAGDYSAAVWFKVANPGWPGSLSCWLRPDLSRADTFTTRSVQVISFALPEFDLPPDTWEEEAAARGIPSQAAALRGLAPAPIKFDLQWTAGVRDVHFQSLDPAPLEGETWRVIMPDEYVTVSWTDIYRQQLRDILLIVIGTLIGVGVTVMIEGLRPTIENLNAGSAKKTEPQPPAGTPPSSP